MRPNAVGVSKDIELIDVAGLSLIKRLQNGRGAFSKLLPSRSDDAHAGIGCRTAPS